MKPFYSLALLIILLQGCSGDGSNVFRLLDAEDTGIGFANTIGENDSINIIDLEYVYNGGGVAIADFNNDSLPDIYFTGNRVPNKLYLNEGDLHFRDVTDMAKADGAGKWSTGVVAVDINNDGLMDLYVGASIKPQASARANILYINKGVDKNGVPVFEDMALAYNVADTGHTTHSAFFDYDNDGDLDLYVLTNKLDKEKYPNQYRKKVTDGSAESNDRLYRNDWDSAKGHPVFTDVTKQAGILIEGYGLGLNITDINRDGWKDIYVTNDFLTNDLLWINNRNGTFTNKAEEYFKHTSYSAMGNDVADINNDGLMDIIAVDMLPDFNYRKKMMMPANSYQNFLNNDEFGYQYQYVRNTLQLNQGMVYDGKDSVPHPIFSDIAFLSDVAQTDWSWTPMVTDFDNDGWRDMVITNGYPKDITDRDFMAYRVEASSIASKEMILEQIPEVKLTNYAFRNKGNCQFADVTSDWGLTEPTFSSGAAYGDLDNDGDLDLVINNTNQPAMVYENKVAGKKNSSNYLQVLFEGKGNNKQGLGAYLELYADSGKVQVYEHTPYRGYLSSVEPLAHFGLGKVMMVDSLRVYWPDGSIQVLRNVAGNRRISVRQAEAIGSKSSLYGQQPFKPLFTVEQPANLKDFVHQEIDFSDFNIQKLLPHKLSEYGPAMAAGDLDGNGSEDLVIGGSYGYSAKLAFQQADGSFRLAELLPGATPVIKNWEDMGLVLFDADGDSDLDLYTASGSYENEANSASYRDKFYLNDGKGNFSLDSTAIPDIRTSKSCVRAADYDRDGDLDLFLAGRVEPWHYPKPVTSYILRNDTKGGKVVFSILGNKEAEVFNGIGMVCDAVWSDFDNDGWMDLVLAGEFMPLSFIRNDKGVFRNVTTQTGVQQELGFWNSIAPGDFDEDGDIDYIVGNMGANSIYKGDQQHPIQVYAGDFDNNKSYDAIPALYFRDRDGQRKLFPAQGRDDLIKQMISLRTRYQNYKKYADEPMEKLILPEWQKTALVVKASNTQTSYFRNDGKGKFNISALPMQAQLSMVNGMIVEDFDSDGHLDVLMNTNDYGTEVAIGRYDAMNGLVLKGNGKGGFEPLSSWESGIFIPGNGKAMVHMRMSDGRALVVGSQNRGILKLYSTGKLTNWVDLKPTDASVLIITSDGKKTKKELYYGYSFLSQSGRGIALNSNIKELIISDFKGQTRKITNNP
ncbi:VCBS repeat-containing protein [Flavihumibacter rivuli]|uniref:VCBS repeat-containing protein n=1 Tax=Flavihumibacter rivuli TaxID=2838156 RepID=UPI001BDF160B|nr:VCBS repeat-containing protein [Flavihumibacter rivuli]ULQ58115.1 VCBS repeat-containing protein [Flavihumibacter rivuli]